MHHLSNTAYSCYYYRRWQFCEPLCPIGPVFTGSDDTIQTMGRNYTPSKGPDGPDASRAASPRWDPRLRIPPVPGYVPLGFN